jgi:hypothetical protein
MSVCQSSRDWERDRYSVRFLQEGDRWRWWLYDWKEFKTVQVFAEEQEAQARAICKLLNSIEDKEPNNVRGT